LEAFISSSQQEVALLQLLLKTNGHSVWLHSQENNIGVSGMAKAIEMSSVFVFFQTKSYFERVFTIFKLETASGLKKPVIVIWEGDERCGGCPDFKIQVDECPDKYKTKLFQDEAMKFERRKHLRDAQVNLIAQRIQAKTIETNSLITTSCCRVH